MYSSSRIAEKSMAQKFYEIFKGIDEIDKDEGHRIRVYPDPGDYDSDDEFVETLKQCIALVNLNWTVNNAETGIYIIKGD